MFQKRLSGLGLMSVEKKLLTDLRKNSKFYDEIINEVKKIDRRAPPRVKQRGSN